MLAVVVEAQLRRNRRKRRTWPAYVAALHDRWDCPTALLVICVDPAVAAWCAQPIDFGPGWRGVPLVLGPDLVPILSPADQRVAAPEMAVLSALAHGGGPDYRAALDALVEALSHTDAARAASYTAYVIAALPEVARTYLEALMRTVSYRYQGEYAHSLAAQGRVEGKADSVLMVLEARKVEVGAESRGRISGCTDVEQLNHWLRRAVTAASVDDLFG